MADAGAAEVGTGRAIPGQQTTAAVPAWIAQFTRPAARATAEPAVPSTNGGGVSSSKTL
jgi:hypothetical protein